MNNTVRQKNQKTLIQMLQEKKEKPWGKKPKHAAGQKQKGHVSTVTNLPASFH